MLAANRPMQWGLTHAQWQCERCGAINNTSSADGLAHVYRDRLNIESPLLDLCRSCWASERSRVQGVYEQQSLFG